MRSPSSRPRRGSAARSGRAWRTPGRASSASLARSPEQISRSGARSRRRAISRRIGAVRLATDGRRLRRRLEAQVRATQLELDPVGTGVCAGRLERRRLVVAGDDRGEAQLRGRDREHARARAPVGEGAVGAPAIGQLQQQLQAHPGGRVGAGAECLAGIDHDVDGPRRGPRPTTAVPRAVRRPRAAGGSPASGPPSRRVSRRR